MIMPLPKLSPGKWVGEVFPVSVRPDSPSRGNAFLLPPYSAIRSVAERWTLGEVVIMIIVFVSYTRPSKFQIWWPW